MTVRRSTKVRSMWNSILFRCERNGTGKMQKGKFNGQRNLDLAIPPHISGTASTFIVGTYLKAPKEEQVIRRLTRFKLNLVPRIRIDCSGEFRQLHQWSVKKFKCLALLHASKLR